MSLREEFEKKCKKCDDYGYYRCTQPTKGVRCFINWFEKRDEEKENNHRCFDYYRRLSNKKLICAKCGRIVKPVREREFIKQLIDKYTEKDKEI